MRQLYTEIAIGEGIQSIARQNVLWRGDEAEPIKRASFSQFSTTGDQNWSNGPALFLIVIVI